MQRTGWTIGALVAAVAVLAWAAGVQAATVRFTYTQTDPSTGFGSIGGSIDTSPAGGPGVLHFSGLLPAATVVQNDPNTGFPVPANAVGFITRGTNTNGGSPDEPRGVYLDLSGPPVVLTAVDGTSTWTVEVPRTMRDGDDRDYYFTAFDDPSGAGDVGLTTDDDRFQFSGWPGDNGAGHRHTGDARDFSAGQDSTSNARSGGLGSNADGDNLGFMAGIRDNNDAPPSFPIFVDDITFGGSLESDDATLAAGPARELPTNVITDVARGGGSGNTPPSIQATALGEDVESFVDRTTQWNAVPALLVGADYVQTANDDKTVGDHSLDVTLAENADLFLLIDDRVGDDDNTTPPTLAGVMDWVLAMGFTDTGHNVGVDEGGDGDIDQLSSVFVLENVPAGVIQLGAQDDGGSRNMYGVSAVVAQPDDVIPEPATMVLAALGIAGLGGYVRRRRRTRA